MDKPIIEIENETNPLDVYFSSNALIRGLYHKWKIYISNIEAVIANIILSNIIQAEKLSKLINKKV